MESPILQLCVLGVVGYVFYLWLSDLKAFKSGNKNSNPLPGATPTTFGWAILGVLGALALVVGETVGEGILGISDEQSSMTLLFATVTISAGFGEELIFRGFFVVQNKGQKVLWLGTILFSLIFAVIHPFLWQWEDGKMEIILTAKTIFSTAVVFLNSVWFYFLRFSKHNKTQSLWPCILAHASSNGAVFLFKLAQGHVDGWY